jgi:hypothetical protein
MPQTKRFEIFLKQETVMNTRINWNFPQTRRGLTGAIDKYIGPGATRDEITREMCKNALRISLISILLLFLMSCVPQQSKSAATEELNDEELAQYALMEFMENLHSRKYDEAARIYGGSYQTMINHNPDVDPNNHATLLSFSMMMGPFLRSDPVVEVMRRVFHLNLFSYLLSRKLIKTSLP